MRSFIVIVVGRFGCVHADHAIGFVIVFTLGPRLNASCFEHLVEDRYDSPSKNVVLKIVPMVSVYSNPARKRNDD